MMRCPYCNTINADRASFCARCGRELSGEPPRDARYRPAAQQPSPTPPAPRQSPPLPGPLGSSQLPPSQQPRPGVSAPRVPAPPARTEATVQPQQATVTSATSPTATPAEPPAPFPPRTFAQLQALEPASLPYTVVGDSKEMGNKKVVRISYQRCSPWQQVATLLKAFKDKRDNTFNTIIVQGVSGQERDLYNFINGQLRFDRNVRLGSQNINRYQIETGNGFDADSIRIVLSE